jgi:tetratricopeptide (TPR) repeat protein
VTRPRGRRLGLLLLGLFSAAGCRPAVESPQPLPLPGDFAQQDPPVRRLFEDRRQALLRLLADPEVAPSAVGDGFGELSMAFHAYEYWDGAAEGYARAARLAPDSFRWHYYRGRVLRILGSWEASDAAFGRALEIRPADLAVLTAFADSLLARDRTADAAALYERALAVDAHCAAGLYGVGRIAHREGDAARAVELLDAAHAEQPKATEVQYALGLALRDTGQADRAAALLAEVPASNLQHEKVARDDPWMADIEALRVGGRSHVLRGIQALAADLPDLAAIEFRQALAADAKRVHAYYGLGLALDRLGRAPEAIEAFSRLLEEAPDDADGHVALARILERQGAATDAEHHLERAIALEPRQAAAHLELALLLRRSGRRDAARAEFEAAFAVDQGSDETRLWQALLRIEAGEDAAALELVLADASLAWVQARIRAASRDPGLRDGAWALAATEGLTYRRPTVAMVETRAMAEAELGHFDRAAHWQEQALATARSADSGVPAAWIERRLRSYRAGRPCRSPWEPDEFLIETSQRLPGPSN